MSNRIVSVLRKIGPKLALRGLVLVMILVLAGYWLNRTEFSALVEALDFSDGPQTGWLHGKLAYFAVASLFTAAGGPRQASSFFAAFFFGELAGLGIAIAASMTGAAIAYGFAVGFRRVARRILRGRVDVAARVWSANPFSITLILRLLPVGSNFLVNLAAGAAGIPALRFLTASGLGYLPQTVVFCLLGAGVNIGSQTQIGVSIALFAGSILVGIWVYSRYRRDLRGRVD